MKQHGFKVNLGVIRVGLKRSLRVEKKSESAIDLSMDTSEKINVTARIVCRAVSGMPGGGSPSGGSGGSSGHVNREPHPAIVVLPSSPPGCASVTPSISKFQVEPGMLLHFGIACSITGTQMVSFVRNPPSNRWSIRTLELTIFLRPEVVGRSQDRELTRFAGRGRGLPADLSRQYHHLQAEEPDYTCDQFLHRDNTIESRII